MIAHLKFYHIFVLFLLLLFNPGAPGIILDSNINFLLIFNLLIKSVFCTTAQCALYDPITQMYSSSVYVTRLFLGRCV